MTLLELIALAIVALVVLAIVAAVMGEGELVVELLTEVLD